MKFKLLGVIAGSLMCSTAFAAKSDFTGYYVGARAGEMITQTKIENNSSAMFENTYDSENVLAANSSNNVSNNSLAGDLFFGYGKFVNNSRFYLGGEGFIQVAQPEGTLNASSFHAQPGDDSDYETLSTSTETSLERVGFGVDFRPGYLLDNQTLVYGRLGLAFNRETVNAKNSFVFHDIDDDTTTTNTLNASRTDDTVGYRLGLGVERKVNSRLSMTVDYIYTNYKRVNVSGTGDVRTDFDGGSSTVTNGFVNNANGSIATQEMLIGLKYNIA